MKSTLWKAFIRRWKAGTLTDVWEDWKWIFSYSRRFKGQIILYTLMGILSSTLGIVSAIAGKFMIDVVVERKTDQLWLVALIMLGSAIISLVMSNTSNRITQKLSVNMSNAIKEDVFDSIMDAGWQSLNQYPNGDILNRFHGDISSVSGNAVSWIPTTILAVYNFIASFIVIWHYSPVMSLIALSSAPVLLAMSRFLLKKQKEYRIRMMESTSRLYSFETETLYNLDTVKSFGIMNIFSEQLRELQRQYRHLTLSWNMFHIKTNILMTLMSLLVEFASYGYALFLLWSGQITYGTMTLFLGRRGALSGAFQSVAGIIPNFITSSVSAHRVRELTMLPKEKHDGEEPAEKYGKSRLTVRLDNVRFAYEDGTENVLEHSDFEAHPGEITALVGPSGEGKTTVLRLLLGIIAPAEGSAAFYTRDGEKISITAESRRLISYVPQGNSLLSGSIRDNLRLACPNATEEQMRETLEMAAAWEFVEKMPHGIDSNIFENGHGLSEGQAQRISIARALLRDAPIILMDEATSALDVETERKVLRNILKNAPYKTFILTTHRPTVLSLCNRVYRVVEKKITQLGQEEIDVIVRNF